jgi:ATP-dependent Lhr-like helicase
LKEVLNLLEGFEAPAASWEGELLPSRMKDYDHLWLDMLCLSGYTVWGRFRQKNVESNGKKSPSPIKTTPITLVSRLNLETWKLLNFSSSGVVENLSHEAMDVFELLKNQGASFFDEIVYKTGLLRAQVEKVLAELVARGLLTSDSYTGLRVLLVDSKYRTLEGRRRKRNVGFNMEQAGRWSLLTKIRTEMTRVVKELLITIAGQFKRYGVAKL